MNRSPRPDGPRNAPSRALVVGVLVVLALLCALMGFLIAPSFMQDATGAGRQSSAPYAQGYGTGSGVSHRL